MSDRLRLVSHFPGRLRVRADTFRVLPEVGADVAQRLREEAGVESVELSPRTGSIVVTYDPAIVQLAALVGLLVRISGLHGLHVDAPGDLDEASPPGTRLREKLSAWDQAFKRSARGHLDLRVLVPGALAAAGAGIFLFGRRRVPEWYDLLFWSFVVFVNVNPRDTAAAQGHDRIA